MNKQRLITAAVSAALLIATADVSAYAAGLTIGGTSGSAVSVGAGGNNANVNIGQGSGPLLDADSSGSPTGNGSTTNADINLGSLLNGFNLGGGIGGTGGNGGNGGNGAGGGTGAGGSNGGVGTVFAGLSSGDQNSLRLRCRGVLNDPTVYKVDVVNFCRMIIKL